MADFLDEKRKEIQARLKELKPLVEEYERLEAAERALSGVGTTPRAAAAPPPPPRAAAGAARLAQRPPRPPARQRHARHAGVRAGEGPPGITIPELAEAMGIKQNYLYRVMPSLAEDGKVTKSGKGWHAREGA